MWKAVELCAAWLIRSIASQPSEPCLHGGRTEGRKGICYVCLSLWMARSWDGGWMDWKQLVNIGGLLKCYYYCKDLKEVWRRKPKYLRGGHSTSNEKCGGREDQ